MWRKASREHAEERKVASKRIHGTSSIRILVLCTLILPVRPDLVDHLHNRMVRLERYGETSSTNRMVQKEHGIVRSPLGSRIAGRGSSIIRTEASQITMKLDQSQIPYGPKGLEIVGHLRAEQEMGTRMRALPQTGQGRGKIRSR